MDRILAVDVVIITIMKRPSIRFDNRFTPRAILVDLEPDVLESIKSGPYSATFNPQNIISYEHGCAGNNWAKGHYTEGAEIVEEVMDRIRKEYYECDSLQGFQLTHSLGGGTGSGLGTLLITKIREEYPDKIISTFSVLPSDKVSDVVVEPYNAMLASHYLIEQPNETFCFDNEALFNICRNVLNLSSPTFDDLNQLVASCMSDITTPLRFPGRLNLDQLGVTLDSHLRLHFFMTGYGPLGYHGDYNKLRVAQMTEEMFSPRNLMANCNHQAGRYLSCATIFRGPVSSEQVGACSLYH
eukprot:sb/3467456/